MNAKTNSIHHHYKTHGVIDFYKQFGSSYRNPHEEDLTFLLLKTIREFNLNINSVLDLACGSGEITLPLLRQSGKVDGIDPYTGVAYMTRAGQCAESLTFDDIIQGALENRRYSLIVCSYAFHLVEVTKQPLLSYRLTELS